MGIRACIYFHNEEEIRRVKLFLAALRSGLDKEAAVSTVAVATKDIAEPAAPVLDSVAEEPVAEPFEEPVVEKGNPFAGLEMTADGFYILPEGKEIEDYLD